MQSEEIVKALRRGLFSDTLLKLAADKIEELEMELSRLQDSAADAVKVVRCKDCIYSKKSGSQWACLKAIKVGKAWRTNPSNYCASGKRKEE